MEDELPTAKLKYPPPTDDPGLAILGAEIREADIHRFCEETFHSLTCSACHQDDYVACMYSPHTDRVTVIMSAKFETGSDGETSVGLSADLFMPVFYLFCENCGHVRHHLISRVITWMENKAKTEAENELT